MLTYSLFDEYSEAIKLAPETMNVKNLNEELPESKLEPFSPFDKALFGKIGRYSVIHGIATHLSLSMKNHLYVKLR